MFQLTKEYIKKLGPQVQFYKSTEIIPDENFTKGKQIPPAIYQENRDELLRYIDINIGRFEFTLSMMKRLRAGANGKKIRIFEVGSTPYFLSYLLMKMFDCEIVGSTVIDNHRHIWPGEDLGMEKHYIYTTVGSPVPHEVKVIEEYFINVEKDELPFEDGSFDMVLCFEAIEHLILSPTHMLYELNRVLKRDGLLFLSTPNVNRLKYLVLNLLNKNPYDPYSCHSVYGRHNREYTSAELKELFTLSNFEVLESNLVNIHESSRTHSLLNRLGIAMKNGLLCLPLRYIENKRDHIFIAAKPCGPPEKKYPEFLYEELLPQVMETAYSKKNTLTG